jgi:hypothetical protein
VPETLGFSVVAVLWRYTATLSGHLSLVSGEITAASAQSCIDGRLFIQCVLDCLGRHVDEGRLESWVRCALGDAVPGCVKCYFCARPHARLCS